IRVSVAGSFMHRLAKEQDSAVLMVTHDPRILDVADRIIQVEDGRLGLAYSQEISLALPGLREEQVKAMGIRPALLTYEAGTTIFREGALAEHFYIVLKGSVEAFHGKEDQMQLLNTLERGQYFGEIGLLDPNGRRSASVRVSNGGPAKVMSLERGDFRRLMEGSRLTETAIIQALQERLNRTAITTALPALTTNTIQKILPKIERFKYGPGSNIINAGEPPNYFYIVATGQVEVLITNTQGQQQVASILGAGEYFGEIGLLEQRPRTATVRVSSANPVEVIALSRDIFQQLLKSSRATHEGIARILYERLKKEHIRPSHS
ncbi:MAG: cyclic nucleotide-binding domain-containing protein, partial [Cyanobacteria bacterium P01_F01_bin.153]